MIGIVGFGFVGKAIHAGFSTAKTFICDPNFNSNTIQDLVQQNPEVIFVCVPTPADDPEYGILKGVLQDIQTTNYDGVVAVKSTILPHHLEDFDIVLNPEFLSRNTAIEDFLNPPFVIFGGEYSKCKKLHQIYKDYSDVKLSNVVYTDIVTASLVKYTCSTFFATKITFMNMIFDLTQQLGVNFEELKNILKLYPWMVGVSHLDVPGHEGRGFAGPCLPKDVKAMADSFDLELLHKVLQLNDKFREKP